MEASANVAPPAPELLPGAESETESSTAGERGSPRPGILWGVRLALVFAVFLTFWPALKHGLLPWDDAELIVRNPHVHAPFGKGLVHVWTSAYDGLYAPLFYTSYLLEVAASGEDESALASLIHFDNLALHALAAILVFEILRLLVGGRRDSAAVVLASAVGALFFAVHPLQAEAVNWATGRKDLLGWVFAFLAFREYLVWRQGGKGWHYGAGTALFACALLSKATTASLPLAALVTDYFLLRVPFRSSVKALAPWILGGAVFAWAAGAIQAEAGRPVGEHSTALSLRPLIAADSLAFYLEKVLLPLHLSPVYARSLDALENDKPLLIAALLLVGLPLAFLLRYRNVAAAGVAILVVLLLPTSGIVPFHYQSISTVADRYAYGAILGAALLVSALVARVAQGTGSGLRWQPVAAGAVLVLPLLAFLSWKQSGHWRSSASLWTHAAHIAPGSAVVQNNLGMTYGELDRPEEAGKAFAEAVRLQPKFAAAQNNLANFHLAQDRKERALDHYRLAVEADPRHTVARTNLALLLFQAGQQEEAGIEAAKVLEVDPDNLPALNITAIRLGTSGRGQEALKLLRDAAARNPKNVELAELLKQAEQIAASE